MKVTEPQFEPPTRYHPFREGDIVKRQGSVYPWCCYLVVNAPVPKRKFDIMMYEYGMVWREKGSSYGWNARFIDQCRPDMVENCCFNCGKLKSEHAKGQSCLFTSTKYQEARVDEAVARDQYALWGFPSTRYAVPTLPVEMEPFLNRLGQSIRHLRR